MCRTPCGLLSRGSFAAESGFDSGKNLNLVFRRICKMSPTEFRSRHQKPADGEG